MQLATEALSRRAPRSRCDYRESQEKVPCRAFNLAALEDSTAIAIPGERLNLDWLELPGKGAPMYDLLKPLLIGYGRFIGVDRDPTIIAECKARNLPRTVWHKGELKQLLSNQPAAFARVGVLNYDSHEGWHSDAIIRETASLVAFAAKQFKVCGEFVLIVNAYTRNMPRSVTIPRVQRLFAPLLAPLGRQVEAEDILEYTAAGGTSKMINVRVKLGFC